MVRPLRVEYEGACYHVINRGNRREVVFKNGGTVESRGVRLRLRLLEGRAGARPS